MASEEYLFYIFLSYFTLFPDSIIDSFLQSTFAHVQSSITVL